MRLSITQSLAILVCGWFTSTAAAGLAVVDASFDDPANGNGYGPIVGWTQSPFPSGNPGFASGYLTGPVTAGSAFWDNGTVPGEGVSGKVGAIQTYSPFGNNTMSLEQTVSGFVAGTSYVLTYDENSRAGTSAPNLEVFVGGQSVVAAHLDSAVDAGGTFSTPFRVVNSVPFTIPGGGSALVEFRVTVGGSGDSSALIDNVAINAVPEPASIVLWGVAIAGGLLVARRRKA